MKLTEICVRRPVFATMLIVSLVVMGLASYKDLGLDLFPKVDFPNVTVTITLKGASPEEMETQVTKLVEEAVNTINGVDEIRSTTREGVSQTVVVFVLEKNIDIAAQDVRDKVGVILGKFPKDTDPPVISKIDPDASPVLAVSISGKRSAREITEIATKSIKEPLETVYGVGSVTLVGAREREIQVNVNPEKLKSFNLTIADVKDAIASENIEIPGGRVTSGKNEKVLRTLGRVQTPEEFGNIAIKAKNSSNIHIKDVAEIVDGTEEVRSLSRVNGENSVSMLIRRQSGTNTVKVVEDVRKKLENIKNRLPSDLKVYTLRDQSRFIKKSFEEVRFHLILGSILASLVVFLFIRNVRSTLIAAVAIPSSIIATFTALKYFDFTLNNMTMLALSLCTGIVIDDAIVVLENIFRYVEEKGIAPAEAAVLATKEIGLAVSATTLSLVVIFLPVAFMSGIVGKFFFSFGITASCAIIVSLLVAFTLTPMLCSRFLKKGGEGKSREIKFIKEIDNVYAKLLSWALKQRGKVSLFAVGIMATVFMIFPFIGKELVSDDDTSEFEVIAEAPESYSIEATDAVMKLMEEEIKKLPDVNDIFTTIGVGETGKVSLGSIYVGLKPMKERDKAQYEIMRLARSSLKKFSDLKISVQNVGRLSGGGFKQTPFNMAMTGPDLKLLEKYSEQIAAKARAVKGMVDVDVSTSARKPEIRITVDREKSSSLAVKTSDVASALKVMVGGEEVTKFKEGDEQYPVMLRLMEHFRKSADNISQLTVPSKNGSSVLLSNIVKIEEDLSPAQIERYNRVRQVTISSNLEPELALGKAVDLVKKDVSKLNLQPGYNYIFIGRAKTMQEAAVNFLIALVLSLIFVYLILAAQFESFHNPLTIILSFPLSLPFGLISLWLVGKTLNVYSAIGVLMLFGVIKKNAILQIDFANHLRREEGMQKEEAILKACHIRLRPILMTTASLVFGMLPIALGRGDGSAARASMATVIVGGQILALVLTLVVVPVFYSLIDDFVEKIKKYKFSNLKLQILKRGS